MYTCPEREDGCVEVAEGLCWGFPGTRVFASVGWYCAVVVVVIVVGGGGGGGGIVSVSYIRCPGKGVIDVIVLTLITMVVRRWDCYLGNSGSIYPPICIPFNIPTTLLLISTTPLLMFSSILLKWVPRHEPKQLRRLLRYPPPILFIAP